MNTRTRIPKTAITPAGGPDREAAWAERSASLDGRGPRKGAITPAAAPDWDAKTAQVAGRRKH